MAAMVYPLDTDHLPHFLVAFHGNDVQNTTDVATESHDHVDTHVDHRVCDALRIHFHGRASCLSARRGCSSGDVDALCYGLCLENVVGPSYGTLCQSGSVGSAASFAFVVGSPDTNETVAFHPGSDATCSRATDCHGVVRRHCSVRLVVVASNDPCWFTHLRMIRHKVSTNPFMQHLSEDLLLLVMEFVNPLSTIMCFNQRLLRLWSTHYEHVIHGPHRWLLFALTPHHNNDRSRWLGAKHLEQS